MCVFVPVIKGSFTTPEQTLELRPGESGTSHHLERYQTKSDPGTVVFYKTAPFAWHG